MATVKMTKGVTGIGEIFFAHLIKPEEYQGKSTNKFTLMLKLNEKDKKKLLSQIEAEWEKFKETEEGQKHKYKYDYENGLKEYKDEEYFKFKMTHMINTRKGDVWERHVPLFDAKCNDIHDTITGVGNGTKARVSYELSPFYMNDKLYGISLRMTGVQILELVDENSASASSLGFGEEEGYVQQEESIQIPFDAVDEEEDF